MLSYLFISIIINSVNILFNSLISKWLLNILYVIYIFHKEYSQNATSKYDTVLRKKSLVFIIIKARRELCFYAVIQSSMKALELTSVSH
jgi:hypothetical protein